MGTEKWIPERHMKDSNSHITCSFLFLSVTGFLDRIRTTLNVTGDSVVCAIVAARAGMADGDDDMEQPKVDKGDVVQNHVDNMKNGFLNE